MSLSEQNRATIERIRNGQPGYSIYPADINEIMNAARAEGQSHKAASLDREKVARIIYFMHGDDLSLKAALSSTNDAHWIHWRDVEPQGTEAAFKAADTILALPPTDAGQLEPVAWTFEYLCDNGPDEPTWEPGASPLNPSKWTAFQYRNIQPAFSHPPKCSEAPAIAEGPPRNLPMPPVYAPVPEHGSGSTKRTMTLNLTEAETEALEDLAKRKDLSPPSIFRQALKVYQLVELGHADLVRKHRYPMASPSTPNHSQDTMT